jgi:hypothetical protein
VGVARWPLVVAAPAGGLVVPCLRIHRSLAPWVNFPSWFEVADSKRLVNVVHAHTHVRAHVRVCMHSCIHARARASVDACVLRTAAKEPCIAIGSCRGVGADLPPP